MSCSECDSKSVFLFPELCKEHFIAYFEDKVFDTITKFGLLKKGESVVVACSGGKDSTAILYLLQKFHGKVVALAIDEGISGYREKTLVDLENFCKANKIELRTYSFEREVGKTLDSMLKQKTHPCTVCGTFRRYLLNKHAKRFDKLATGHNMDDESQAVLMNLMKGNADLIWNSTPITSEVKGFVQKIKPLYFCSEKEVAAYILIKGFDVGFTECPNMNKSFRNRVRDVLNDYEFRNKGTKKKHSGKTPDIVRKNRFEKKGIHLLLQMRRAITWRNM